MRRFRKLAVAATLAPWAAIAVAIAQGRAPRGWLGWDLASFRVAAKLLASGRPLYDFAAQNAAYHAEYGKGFDVLYPFAYPPIFAIEVQPLARMPHALAFALIFVASLAVAALAVRKLSGDARDAFWVLGTFPGLVALLAGQFSFFALGLVVACFALLEKNRALEAGLVLSLLAFKPQLLLFLPFVFVVRRAWRALAGLAVGLGAQAAISFLVAPKDTLAFPRMLATFSRYVSTSFQAEWSFTWRAFFALLAPGHAAVTDAIGALAAAACAAAGLVAMWRAREDLARCMAIAVLATFAAAWHAYAYDWVVLAFPVFVLLPRARLSRSIAATLGVLYVALWTFVWLAKAETRAMGFAIQPAMPALAFASFVLARRAR